MSFTFPCVIGSVISEGEVKVEEDCKERHTNLVSSNSAQQPRMPRP
jgi:hypothetical protein